ncbi:hypothetical protein A2767_05165 [Candidatus Roizmanbacteria bacterium RIFCSPHIGHO2_01_FULL_35_10]|uniref:Uncharacterized protein n=1 Tax=Candidatus Roizmanbacteria bacterium RIFCSPLOWO2_01_FULL_35_13 TaxID=1802055 RepID=A0A1F7IBI2_9BACT|nr:MAG: hypothetical protein A2767_05165 [Candidatus Roizmanbacteria bacterium RIFCSPHIGHO2_01_FULL_35_10]OGK40711.1 MAG: hypothetical protein A3A74_03780 [Candidatus Roizmanbacteria bacterium RIFCSPLOWO2_01_FULL_35_13]
MENRTLLCRCKKIIPIEGDGAGNTLVHYLRVIYHLKGPPHNFKYPVHLSTGADGKYERFGDDIKPGFVVSLERK